eukprot:1414996-Prymnesium_polylepis.2
MVWRRWDMVAIVGYGVATAVAVIWRRRWDMVWRRWWWMPCECVGGALGGATHLVCRLRLDLVPLEQTHEKRRGRRAAVALRGGARGRGRKRGST